MTTTQKENPKNSVMERIALTQGKVALVDDSDFEFLSQWKWFAIKSKRTYYAVRKVKGRNVCMHNVILGVDPGNCDHRDRDGLNNQRSNLRMASNAQNQANRRVRRDSTTGYRGVHFRWASCRWVANITVAGERIWLGSFDTPVKAARAFDSAAKQFWGEFACRNFK